MKKLFNLLLLFAPITLASVTSCQAPDTTKTESTKNKIENKESGSSTNSTSSGQGSTKEDPVTKPGNDSSSTGTQGSSNTNVSQPTKKVAKKVVALSTNQENNSSPVVISMFLETSFEETDLTKFKLKLMNNAKIFNPTSFSGNKLVFVLGGLKGNTEFTIEYVKHDENDFEFNQRVNKSFRTLENNESNNEPGEAKPGEDPFGGSNTPNFPWLNRDYSAENSYPSNATGFTVVDPQVIYKEIYDRTFSVKFGVNLEPDATKPVSFMSTASGTTWLLDYHKVDENKYKLFFATNLHVMAEFSNSLTDQLNRQLNYEDFRGIKVNSISLGKSKADQTSFPDRENRYPYSREDNFTAKYYASDRKFTNIGESDRAADKTLFTTGITSQPKIVFAGYDFIDRQYMQDYQEDLKQQARKRLEELDPSDDEYKNLKRTLDNNEFIPSYTDFGIFEVDIDLSLMDETFRSWVSKAINGVNSYLTRLKNTAKLPNQDKSVSSYMQTMDYVTANNTNDTSGNNLRNARDLFIGGYPGKGGGNAFWSRNNPIERQSESESSYNRLNKNNKNSFAYASGHHEEKMGFNGPSIYTSVFGRTLAHYYGYNLTVRYSSLTYGSSGSVVYNEFGQMVGVYNQVSADVDTDDLLREARFLSLLLAKDQTINNKTIKAYNLIDGTDKSKYPAQTASFRQNLMKIYPNGFADGRFNTALFPEGFKKD
ncbi:MIP family Ig-specific serine endopeptidase [Mycoplasmopsis edwardii]|uniref:DUF31 family protein n=1 Tax=Mycoplasmopsis edwardii TaxID=53558 RepID=A0ACD4PH06_9BACT|nr:DUF31 family protein [Mycoplasmopsis edwardii]WBP83949.1 DUF31 family protein [Mycoplasmopsis edwardii]